MPFLTFFTMIQASAMYYAAVFTHFKQKALGYFTARTAFGELQVQHKEVFLLTPPRSGLDLGQMCWAYIFLRYRVMQIPAFE